MQDKSTHSLWWTYRVELVNDFRDSVGLLEFWWWGEGCWTFTASNVEGQQPSKKGIRIYINRKLVSETPSREDAKGVIAKAIANAHPKCKVLLESHAHHMMHALGLGG
jgi:hypothetical protein